jgi:AraC-like DNA-binding protein
MKSWNRDGKSHACASGSVPDPFDASSHVPCARVFAHVALLLPLRLSFSGSMFGRSSQCVATRGELPRYRLCRSEECLGAVWFCTASSPRAPLNVSDELELNVVLAGSVIIRVGSELHSLSAGDVLWMAPGQVRTTVACSPDLAMWALMFRQRLTEELRSVQSFEVCGPAERGSLGHERLREFSANAYWLLRSQKRVEPFNRRISDLLSSVRGVERGAGGAVRPQHQAVAKAAQFLQNPSDRLSLTQLARQVGLSPYQLSRTFHRQVGVPLSHYTAHQAVQRFAQLSARDPSTNLLECALAAGFGSYAQFYRSFSFVVGLAPREHRRLLDDGTIPPLEFSQPELPCAPYTGARLGLEG